MYVRAYLRVPTLETTSKFEVGMPYQAVQYFLFLQRVSLQHRLSCDCTLKRAPSTVLQKGHGLIRKKLSKIPEARLDSGDMSTKKGSGNHFLTTFPRMGKNADKYRTDAAPKWTITPFHTKSRNTFD